MNQTGFSTGARFTADDISKLKRVIIDLLSRGLESEGVTSQQRADFVKLHIKSVYEQAHVSLPDDIQRGIFQDVLNDMMGYGPIQPLLDDPEVTEVMVNGPKKVFIEKNGKLVKSAVTFENDDHVLRII